MTCVVGVRGPKGVLLAGDSQYSWENRNGMGSEASAKTYELSEVLAIAYHGSGRLGQILIYELEHLQDPPLGRDELRWAVKDFVPHLRSVAEDHGFLHIHNWNVEHLGEENGFLFAVRGRLFNVGGDFSIDEHRRPFDATGSGQEVAIGAMNALVGDTTKPVPEAKMEKVALAGVQAASDLTNFVGGDITMVNTVSITDEEKKFMKGAMKT